MKRKAYRGPMRIRCTRSVCDRGIDDNVVPACMDCPGCAVDVLSLEEKVIHEHRPAPAARVRPRRSKR